MNRPRFVCLLLLETMRDKSSGGGSRIKIHEEWSVLVRRWCRAFIPELVVIRYFVSPPIRSHRLGQAAHRAWHSIANADAPFANELATTFAFGGHRDGSSGNNQHGASTQVPAGLPMLCSSLMASRASRFMSAPFRSSIQADRLWLRIYQCFDRRITRKVRHRPGSNQEYQSLPSSRTFVRLLDRTLPAPSVADQFESEWAAVQWLQRGITEV